MVIITSMHYESTVIHNAGVSESNFLEKFAHAVADPAIMEVLKSMMLGSVTPAHHEEQYSHNHRVGDLSHEWCRPLFNKQSGSTSIIMSTTLLKSMHDTAHRLEIQDTVPNFREREREREREMSQPYHGFSVLSKCKPWPMMQGSVNSWSSCTGRGQKFVELYQ